MLVFSKNLKKKINYDRKKSIENTNNILILIDSLDELNIYISSLTVMLEESTYSIIIKKFCELKDIYSAFIYLDKMKKYGLRPKLRTYSPLIKLITEQEDIEKFIYIFNEIEQNKIKLLEEDYSRIIYLCVKYKLSIFNIVIETINKYMINFTKPSFNILEQVLIQKPFTPKKIDINKNTKIDLLTHLDKFFSKNNKKKLIKWLNIYKVSKNITILDGANIGYYNNRTNKDINNILNIFQINNIITYLYNLGYIPLIILHNRHITYRTLNNAEQKIIDNWTNKNLVYWTPNNTNDDIFWIYGTIYLSLYTNIYLITNDQLRDHKFILSKYNINNLDYIFKIFNEYYILNYSIIYNKIELEYPSSYTICIQQDDNKDSWFIPIKNNDFIIFYNITY